MNLETLRELQKLGLFTAFDERALHSVPVHRTTLPEKVWWWLSVGGGAEHHTLVFPNRWFSDAQYQASALQRSDLRKTLQGVDLDIRLRTDEFGSVIEVEAVAAMQCEDHMSVEAAINLGLRTKRLNLKLVWIPVSDGDDPAYMLVTHEQELALTGFW